jgi:uncharacterized protein
MPHSPHPVFDTQAMIAGMDPLPDDEDYVFCTVDASLAETMRSEALAWFAEDEGVSLILPADRARALGLPDGALMRRIVLTVHSALEGVGLTAAVAGKLAEHGIACNMVAAFHHDHVFVPAGDAARALALLRELQAAARS